MHFVAKFNNSMHIWYLLFKFITCFIQVLFLSFFLNMFFPCFSDCLSTLFSAYFMLIGAVTVLLIGLWCSFSLPTFIGKLLHTFKMNIYSQKLQTENICFNKILSVTLKEGQIFKRCRFLVQCTCTYCIENLEEDQESKKTRTCP